ncbi:MAG: thioredoxin domain-containing protein, partial [Candidatus Omnitrophica bacterium]|nr:thioredoxin domain-containing protein [Candidatus Omnitrophota bacterium]
MKTNLRSILTGVLLVLFLAGAVFFIKRNKPAPVLPLPSVAGGPEFSKVLKVRGPATAPVKIVEYSDFECPSCRVVQTDLQNLFKNYPGQIQLTFKHFPLTSHKWSIYAHQAAECMNAQGKFWPYQDKIYEKQSEWAPSNVPPVEILAKYAKELGADMDRFGKCMADVAVTREIYAEKEEGNKQQVNATPTFFLGEERFVGPKEMQERGENAIR